MITIITKDYQQNISIEGVIKETRTLTASVTKNPVASGAKVSDNILIQPRTYTLEGRISPHKENTVYENLKALDFVKAQWKNLQNIWLSKQLIEVITEIDNYDNMVIENLNYERESSNSEVVDFTATITEVFMIETGADTITIKPGPDYNQGSPIKAIGIREASNVAQKKGQDYLKKIISEFPIKG